MSGADLITTIPSVVISRDGGDALIVAFTGDDDEVEVKFTFSSWELVGGQSGLVRLYAPYPLVSASFKSHWYTSAMPNLLMEPAVFFQRDTRHRAD